MISSPRLIELLQPAATSILSADATAIARLAERRSAFAGLDHQPVAAAMAGERRAIVATEMRTVIAPSLGWTLVEDNLACGAYEWLVSDVAVRLSKTTRASRLEAAKALLGIQDTLFETTADPAGPRDEVLIRLMGNALKEASVDVIPVGHDGSLSTAIPLKAIATVQVERIPSTDAPAKTSVTLPGTRRHAVESG
jgi:hypothetical protein